MIRINGIFKSFGDLEVLKGVNAEIAKGEVVSIVGASGAGKTTLLQLIGTLDHPTSGQILFNDKPVGELNDRALSAFRNKNIGFVFQFHQLLPEFTALENVCIPAFIRGTSKNKAQSEALKLLDLLGMTHRKDHKPGALSGGEQQRIAVARAMINQPEVILADEPSGNLDSANARELHSLFFRLREELGQTFIIVTHNEELAQMADRKLVMKDGVIL